MTNTNNRNIRCVLQLFIVFFFLLSMPANGNNPARLELVLFNTTNVFSQRGFIDPSNSGNTGIATGTSSVDSGLDQTLSLKIDLSDNTDDWICDYVLVELVKK